MTITSRDLFREPNALAAHYSRFRVAERTLLTGHSHQAWPDAAFRGHERAFLDAAEWVDDKWARAFAAADEVRAGYRQLLGDPSGCYSLAASTHDLLVKLLSALPWHERRRIVTTDGEFYSLTRQLQRLEEAGLEVCRIAAHPAATVGERLAAAVDDRTAATFVSTVFFSSGQIAGDLTATADACRLHGSLLILDVYHQLNIVPYSLSDRGLEDAYVVGAGYKYCQLGEGNAFLRFPPDCSLRPIATGWFAQFQELTTGSWADRVSYPDGDDRFAGATYDPTSHYRGATVFDFFAEQALHPQLLREVSQHQVSLLADRFDRKGFDQAVIDRDRSIPISALGGFLALRSSRAGEIQRGLRQRRVATDFRDTTLRLGPAPYLSDTQLEDAIEALGEVVHSL